MKIPSDTTIQVNDGKLVVKGPKSTLEKAFAFRFFDVKIEGDELTVVPKQKSSRRVYASQKSIEAHVRNLIKGVHDGYSKKLSIVYAHFPISVEVKGKDVLIKNFLGEKTPRDAKVIGEAKVSVSGQEITVSGSNKEDVGQTASNIVRATRILKRDIRVFQDGIYYT